MFQHNHQKSRKYCRGFLTERFHIRGRNMIVETKVLQAYIMLTASWMTGYMKTSS